MPVLPTLSGLSRRFGQGLALVSVVSLAACAQPVGPSVPTQAGKTIEDARFALESCKPRGPKGATENLVGAYAFGVILGGLILGPIVVASNTQEIKKEGARIAVDDCLEDQGYERRELTPQEVQFMNNLTSDQRQIFLDYMVEGGSLEGFRSEYQVY